MKKKVRKITMKMLFIFLSLLKNCLFILGDCMCVWMYIMLIPRSSWFWSISSATLEKSFQNQPKTAGQKAYRVFRLNLGHFSRYMLCLYIYTLSANDDVKKYTHIIFRWIIYPVFYSIFTWGHLLCSSHYAIEMERMIVMLFISGQVAGGIYVFKYSRVSWFSFD